MITPQKVLVLGGGSIGLATAIELAQNGAEVTILNHQPKSAALYAAAGMLAPQAERIQEPHFLDLCLQSRNLYPEWIQGLEAIAQLYGGYWPCGILSPLYSAPDSSDTAQDCQWFDQSAIRKAYPYLSRDVIGGWLYRKDAQVNNRLLGQVLNRAAQAVGVKVHHDVTINSLVSRGDRIYQVKTQSGDWSADHYLLTTGAWTGMLGDVPVVPRKGQMLAVTPMDGYPAIGLNQVLFGEKVYIVPRQTGEVIIGATSEDVGFTPGNTAGGVHKLLNAAIRLLPKLSEYEIYQQWWGYRPTTPDELPILGASPWENLSIASGHYRNGILLTPITARLMSQHILKGDVEATLSP
ncbi:MAG: glycine oxidase ThiO, partial [Cyanobacteria bacterium P01_F01_bin.42]